jgi:general secretion pathway protein D
MQSRHTHPAVLSAALMLASGALACAQSSPAAAPASPTPAPATGQILTQSSSSRPLFKASPYETTQAAKTRKKIHVSEKDRSRAEDLSVAGTKELLADHPRAAMNKFHRAGQLDPTNPRYHDNEAIAREHLVTQLVQQAEKSSLLGHLAESRQQLAEAFHLDPRNPEVTQHYADLLDASRDPIFQTTSDVRLAEPPIVLQPTHGLHSFHFKASAQQVVQRVMEAYGIHPTFESTVKDEPLHFDADNINYAQAAHLLTLVTDTFLVPLDPARVLLVPDTKENRTTYERQALETIYLPGLNEDERRQVSEIARNVFEVHNPTLEAAHGTMTLRAPQSDLNAFNRTLTDILQGRSEILLDVRMYEIDRSVTRDQGVLLPNSTTLFNIPTEVTSILTQNASLVDQIISAGLVSPTDYIGIAAILVASGQVTGTPLNQPFAYFGGGLSETGLNLSSGTENAQFNVSDVRSLDRLQLRAEDQQEEEVRSGTRYPIVTSSYSSLSPSSTTSIPGINAAGVSSALTSLGLSASALTSATETIPQVQYEDLGLTLHVTPHVSGNGDVSLKFDLKLDSLQGSTLNDIPILDDRELTAVTALKPGQSVLLMSNVTKQVSDAITGIPGINELPGLQEGTDQNNTKSRTELAVVITPHVIRRVHIGNADPMILISQH